MNKSRLTPSATLREHALSPRKRLGQSFLQDPTFISRIVAAADLCPEDEVLEVGGGTGVLSDALAEVARRLVTIELDDALVDLLQNRFAGVRNVEVVHGNALTVDPAVLFAGRYKLIANIPYYITAPLIRHFLDNEHQPRVAVLMVQREVARRIVAQPGELSLLGVSVQYYSRASVIARVPAGAFFPRPNVDSAIVRLVTHRAPGPGDAGFFDVVRAGFGMRRKQLINSLSAGLGMGKTETTSLLQAAGIPVSIRAEELSIADWERLAAARHRLSSKGED